MTKDESGRFLNELISLYPNLIRPQQSVKMLAELWAEALADQDYEKIHAALIAYFKTDTRGFVPTAAQLIEFTEEPEDPLMPKDHVFMGW